MVTITRKSATELTIESLLDFIKKGSLSEGDRFPTEKNLCEMLSVGRGTVREAVKVLASQGYLEIRPGTGTYLKSREPEKDAASGLSSWFSSNELELQHLIVVRSSLEPLAVRLAVENCSPEQLQELKKIHEASQAAAAADDAAALATLDEQFHTTIFRITENPLLIEINALIIRHLAEFRSNTFRIRGNVDNFIPAHESILRAFQAHDPSMGEKKMRQHIKRVAKDLESSKYRSLET